MQDHSVRAVAWNEAADYEMANQEKRRTKTDQTPFKIKKKRGESDEQAMARTMLSPALQSAWTLKEYVNSPVELDLASLIDALELQTSQIEHGNLGRIEEILIAQAHTLDAIFNNLVCRGINAEYLNNFETFLKLGLRAQSQCRATLETLASIKNPTILMRQTNIAHNQQVNNDLKTQNAHSKLLEKSNGERLDFGKAGTPVNADSDVETVGAVNRAENA